RSIGYFRPDRWFHLRLDVLVLLDCYGDGRCRRYYWLHSVLVARYRAVDTGSVDNFITARIKSRGSSPLWRSEEHTSELQSRFDLVCRLLLEKKKCLTNKQ